jgi:DNA repair exonuclease SbcCD ATPase subunit
MNICFEKITIKNFLSIGFAEIDFRNLGYVLVQGRNNSVDDNASSNGSGKSSIFEAISWVLTGETVRGVKSGVANIKANQGALVEIQFIIDNKKIRIVRTKDDIELGTTLKLFVNGEDKSGKGIRDTSKILCEYLPDITPSLIGSVIILGQSLPQRFSNNTPSGRKEVLESLSKSDFMIADLKERIANRKQLLLDTIKELEIEHKSLETKKELLESRLASVEQGLSDMGSSDEISEKLKQEKKSLQCKKKELNCIEESLSGEKDAVQTLRDTYVQLLQKKSESGASTAGRACESKKIRKIKSRGFALSVIQICLIAPCPFISARTVVEPGSSVKKGLTFQP